MRTPSVSITRRRALLSLSCAGAGIGLAGRAFAQAANSIAPPGLGGQDEEPKILLTIAGDDGSATTIIPQIAVNYLRFRGASGIAITEADPPWTSQVNGTMLNGQKVAILIRASSSTDGMSLLAAGMADIGLSLREVRPNELPGFMTLTPAEASRDERPIALNAMQIIVNKATGIARLSFDNSRRIFAGKIIDWSAVGGRPGPIHRYGRAIDYKSSNLLGTSMGDETILPGLRVVSSYAAMRDSVAGDPQAIGYIPVNFIYHEHMNWTGEVEAVRFQLGNRLTAMPNEYGLATGDYPLVFPILLYRVPGRDNPEIETFFQLADSAQARVLEMFAGLTPVAPRLLVPRFESDLPAPYGDIVRNALRISTTVRFEPGAAKVDSSAKRSFDDLGSFLRRLDISPERLRHLAFSEDTGTPDRNHDIADELGAVFQRELRARNVRAGELVALGAIYPLAASDNPRGQWLNRRVETWITP
ncbi:MAG TPA: substrate-binding domain-containing protein [Xanthobacteraceae bacterium]|nr:substrate-binding domain-containing protein [Xanthobacteraceae bacterium]